MYINENLEFGQLTNENESRNEWVTKNNGRRIRVIFYVEPQHRNTDTRATKADRLIPFP